VYLLIERPAVLRVLAASATFTTCCGLYYTKNWPFFKKNLTNNEKIGHRGHRGKVKGKMEKGKSRI
jgi:hypothetical protein